MRKILLTQGKIALVDDEDYEYLNQWKWHAVENRSTFYAVRAVYVSRKKITIWMHRAIMDTPIGMETDHIDHNGLNNQKSNLRICTRSQNRQHKRMAHGKVPYLGVSIRALVWDNKPYKAVIVHDREAVFLGYFEKAEEAAMAYNKSAMALHGEFASLNVIPDYTDEKGIPIK